MRVATIDIGTNSVLLLIAELRKSGALHPLLERATITRLGEGVDEKGALGDNAKTRTLSCLKEYAQLISEHDVDRIGAVGTSAMRDAGSDDFSRQVEQVLGAPPEVISGQREALLTFDGALAGLEPDGIIAVFDIGGGSTEIIVGARLGPSGASLKRAVSLDVGSVRLTERYIKSDPPTPDELTAIRREVRVALRKAPSLAGRPLVGVAGTVTTLTAFVHEVVPYDPRMVHGAILSRQSLGEAIDTLSTSTIEQRRALPGIEPARADVIVAGALVADEICAAAEAARLVVSDRGVRWGLANELTQTVETM